MLAVAFKEATGHSYYRTVILMAAKLKVEETMTGWNNLRNKR
jgi:hypothetical protein